MKLWDVSIDLRPGMHEWPGDGPIVAEQSLSRTPEDVANVTRLAITTHTGTHVDPPRHFIHDGATMDDVSLERWVGRCQVVDLRGPALIDASDLEHAGIPDDTERLLLHTNNSALWSANAFVESYVGITPAAARWIVERGIRLVGIDYLSIGPFDDSNTETHRLLLGNGVIIVEGLNLGEIVAGAYELLCLPLKVQRGDGAPARVALRGPLPE